MKVLWLPVWRCRGVQRLPVGGPVLVRGHEVGESVGVVALGQHLDLGLGRAAVLDPELKLQLPQELLHVQGTQLILLLLHLQKDRLYVFYNFNQIMIYLSTMNNES